MEDKIGLQLTWTQYIYSMGLRFDRQQLGDPMLQLNELMQTGSVEEYQIEFERLRAQTRCDEPHSLFMFLGGLKHRLKKLVATEKPISVLDAYNLANLFEKALPEEMWPSHKPYIFYNQPARVLTQTYTQPWSITYSPKPLLERNQNHQTNINPAPPNAKPKTAKPPFNTEQEERRRNNLCFYCDEKFIPGHKCERMKLHNLEVHPNEEET